MRFIDLQEGPNDPGIFKAIFLAGGPGSGKSYVAQQLGLQARGLKVLNSDDAFEYLMRKRNLSFDMPPEEQPWRDVARSRAKEITKKKQDMYLDGRLGLIIDGTAKDPGKMAKIKAELEAIGYQTMMVFVNTSLRTALQRNLMRDRKVPSDIVTQSHKLVQANKEQLADVFAPNYVEVNNDENPNFNEPLKRVDRFIDAPVTPMAKDWISKAQLQKTVAQEDVQSKPKVYVDMDGVIANFYAGVTAVTGHAEPRELALQDMEDTMASFKGTDFFYQLPKYEQADQLIALVNKMTGGDWYILSSPLKYDREGSAKHKAAWIRDKLKIQPKGMHFTGDKAQYATQADGTPNILIDDYPKYLNSWKDKGGIGVKYKGHLGNIGDVKATLDKYLGQQGVAEGYSNTTFRIERRRLNVPALIKAGALFVTYPHGEQGWELDNEEDWAYSLISLYNVMQGGWPSEAKKYLKPGSYRKAAQQINSSAPNLGSDKLVYDGKYNQILWSIKKLNIPDDVAFLDTSKQGVAEGLLNESAYEEAWELISQPVPEIQHFVKQLGLVQDDTTAKKIAPMIDATPDTELPAASIPQLKNLANKGNDVQTLKAIQQISGRPDAAQQYARIMQARDAGEGRQRGYDVNDLLNSVKSGNYESPVLLKLATGTYVIGGRTRLYAALALGIPVKVKIISVSTFSKPGQQGVAEGINNITYKQQKGKNKFSVEMLVDGKTAGVFQYDANTGRTITELDPAFRGQGLGQRLILKGIYTAAMLGMDYVEDESRTAMFDRAMDSLADAGYIVNDEEYWYVTDSGEQFLKQGVAEAELNEIIRKVKGGYRLLSKKGKNLGTYPSKSGAKKREREVQYFKHIGESGIPRDQMPQIDIKDIKGKYNYKKGTMSLDKMKPVQTERLEAEYAEAVEKIQSGKANPIMLDRKGRIVNGHHRYDAYRDLGYKKVPAVLVDATLEELMKEYAHTVEENFADGKVKGKSRPGRVKRAGASCAGSVTDLRAKARKYGGEKGKMYHWCANMKGGKK